jgi:hypothetical protein
MTKGGEERKEHRALTPSIHTTFQQTAIRSLDLSFNGIRHVKNVDHLVKLTDLYFVSNKITQIENLSTLVNITNLELGSNRIRVRLSFCSLGLARASCSLFSL